MNKSLLNHTHDPAARSWVESANRAGGDFPVQNLPFCVFRVQGTDEPMRGGVAIGDQVLDLAETGLVAHAVIDLLEAVEVKIQHCDARLLALGVQDRLFQSLGGDVTGLVPDGVAVRLTAAFEKRTGSR